jgi:hypothetical protein
VEPRPLGWRDARCLEPQQDAPVHRTPLRRPPLEHRGVYNATGTIEKITSAFERFFGTKQCGDHLNVYGVPIRYMYHVKLHTMGRDDKFDEHALPGFLQILPPKCS